MLFRSDFEAELAVEELRRVFAVLDDSGPDQGWPSLEQIAQNVKQDPLWVKSARQAKKELIVDPPSEQSQEVEPEAGPPAEPTGEAEAAATAESVPGTQVISTQPDDRWWVSRWLWG